MKVIPTIEELIEGAVLCIDKPEGWTSFDAVNKLKYRLPRKIKIGHTGTLDPFATGLIIICTGKKTKAINELQDGMKKYVASMVIGASTPTYDCTSDIENEMPIEAITDEQIINSSKKFHGQIDQTIPAFSAIKIDGQRAYKLARKGQEFELKTRPVYIQDFEINHINRIMDIVPKPDQQLPKSYIEVSFTVTCGKGTYIRSIAYDWGRALGNNAFLQDLRRVENAGFNVENAWNLQALADYFESINARDHSLKKA